MSHSEWLLHRPRHVGVCRAVLAQDGRRQSLVRNQVRQGSPPASASPSRRRWRPRPVARRRGGGEGVARNPGSGARIQTMMILARLIETLVLSRC